MSAVVTEDDPLVTDGPVEFAPPWVAIELKPGSIYVVEVEDKLSDKARQWIEERLKSFTEATGVRFLLLDSGLRIASGPTGAPKRQSADWIDQKTEFEKSYRVEKILGSYPECVVKTPGGEIGPFDNRNAAQRELEILRMHFFMAARSAHSRLF